MNLVGYTDRLSAAPGDTVRFMVSSQHPRYRADLVRLIHGDESPAGPGYKEREVPSAINGQYPGRSKPIHSGSFVHVPAHPALDTLTSFTVTAWVFPTTPAAGLQGLIISLDRRPRPPRLRPGHRPQRRPRPPPRRRPTPARPDRHRRAAP